MSHSETVVSTEFIVPPFDLTRDLHLNVSLEGLNSVHDKTK